MAKADPMRQNQYALLVVSAVLVYGAANAVLVTAREYDMPGSVYMGLGFDLLLTVCVVGLLVIVGTRAAPSGLKAAAIGFGALGLIAGLVKLGIRFSSDHGWWTGHMNYVL